MSTLANLLFPGATQDVQNAAAQLQTVFIVIILEIAIVIYLVWKREHA